MNLKSSADARKSGLRRLLASSLLFCAVFSGAAQSWAQKPKREFQLRADSADFWKLFDTDAKLSTVGTGFGFAEGPVWDPAGFVYVSDEETNKIFVFMRMEGRKSSFRWATPTETPTTASYD
jgi:gluconolactonase